MTIYLDVLESERALADIVVDHEGVVDHHTRLQEKAVLSVRILIQVWLVANLSRHFAANRILTEV